MSDPRFARIKTDPRFRRPKRKQQKIIVDERFKSVFDKKGSGKAKRIRPASVDKYGRNLSKTHEEDSLKKYYRLANDSSDEEKGEAEETPRATDYARGGVLMESSDEEENDGKAKIDRAEESDDSGVDDIVRIGGSEDELEIDLDEDTYAELDAQAAAYAKANEALEEKEDVGIANRTRRLAAVNLDWDHVRASHLHKIFSSLVSPTADYVPVPSPSASGKGDGVRKAKGGAAPVVRGSVLSVRVYPSEFGKARMEQEGKEGPPAEIFKKRRKEAQEINERTIYEVGDEDEYDEDALRRYQLERLRYYYAVIECDSIEAALHIYNELEGTELERSANVFDLSFVPDDMSFDVEPRDETTEDVSTNYKPVEYVTDALRHSKVKLTWDDDDPGRHQVTRRQLTRQEIEEGDFTAYIASSSSEDEEGDQGNIKKPGKEVARQKLRTLLLGGEGEALPEGWDNDGDRSDIDLEITFTPGLSDKKDQADETTLEKYQRKIREKRKKNKEEHKEKVTAKTGKRESGAKAQAEGDDFFDFESESGSGSEDEHEAHADTNTKEKGTRGKSNRTRPQSPPREESTVKKLAPIAASSNVDKQQPKHFNMKAVLKAEKQKGKRRKQGKGDQEENELQEDFEIDVKDDRFQILHEDHEFAIDPNNPHFKKTKGMKALLEERRRRQKGISGSDLSISSGVHTVSAGGKGLKSLVESVKRKSQVEHGGGKRQRQ